MNFEWDAAKSTHNARQRGLPFDVAMALFDGPTLETVDSRKDYGECRVKAVGIVRSIVLVCIYVDRPKARRIVSLRKASGKERNAYDKAYPS